MSYHLVQAGHCPCCGMDVARPVQITDGWRVTCDIERGGCGADGAKGETEAEALNLWNVGLYSSAWCPDCGRKDGKHWVGCPSDYAAGLGVRVGAA